MKYLAAAALAITISSGTVAHAGDLKHAVIEPAMIVEEAKAGSSSSAMVIVALTGLFMLAVVAQ